MISNHTTVSGNQFCNPGVIAIPATGSGAAGGSPAGPYPSRIFVSNLPSFCQVTVKLNNLSHTEPDDIDIMLVGPNGQNIVLMSDAGGAATATNVNLIFDDAAAGLIPDAGPLVSGSFKPTNQEGTETFPAPAPAESTNTTLSGAFGGINPNGTWTLYVVDDAGADVGQIAGGWCLSFTSVSCTITGADPVCAATTNNTYTGPSGTNLTYSWSISGNGFIVGNH